MFSPATLRTISLSVWANVNEAIKLNNTMNDPYKAQGYENRKEYLDCLAEDYGEQVYAIAELLGENEDFDGLISLCEDM